MMNIQTQPSSHRKALKLSRIQTCPPRIALTPQLLAENSPHKPLISNVLGFKEKPAPGRHLSQLFTPKKRLYSDIQSSPQKPSFDRSSIQNSPHISHMSSKNTQEAHIPNQYNLDKPGTRLTQRIRNDSCSNHHSETANPKKRFKMDTSQSEPVSCYKSLCSKLIYVSIIFFTLTAISINLWNYGETDKLLLNQTLCSNSSHLNLNDFGRLLKSDVFGQHIAVNQILFELEYYLDTNTTGPLILMFSGWTGTGKTYTAQLLTTLAPVTSHTYILPLHFSGFRHSNGSTNNKLHDMKTTGNRTVIHSNLAFAIKTQIKECALNVFVLDDFGHGMDHIVQDLQEIYNSFRQNTKVVIIVISSTGSHEINRITLNKLLQGELRDALTLGVFGKEIKAEFERVYPSINAVPSIKYIPFLPLERSHIVDCIHRYIKSAADRPLSDSRIQTNIEKVLKLVSFFPSKNPIFSVSGCKKLDTLVDITTLD